MALTPRQQQRLNYLQKVRPNDPQVEQLKKQAAGAPAPNKNPTQGPLPAPAHVPNVGKIDKNLHNEIGHTNFTSAPAVANTQFDINKDIQTGNIVSNNPNYQSPFGYSNTTIDPNTGQPTISTGLSGLNSDLYNTRTNAGIGASNLASNLLGSIPQNYDINSVNGANPIPTDTMADRQKYTDAAYQSLTRGLDTQEQKAVTDQQQDLANRGIPIGSDAYNKAMEQVQQPFTMQKEDAQNQAYAAGGQEQQQSFGRQLAGHQTATGDYNSQYNMPANLASTLLNSGGQVQNGPGGTFNPYAQNSQDLTGLSNSAIQNAQYQQQFPFWANLTNAQTQAYLKGLLPGTGQA